MSVTMYKSITVISDAKGDGEVHDLTHQDSSDPDYSTVPATVSYFLYQIGFLCLHYYYYFEKIYVVKPQECFR